MNRAFPIQFYKTWSAIFWWFLVFVFCCFSKLNIGAMLKIRTSCFSCYSSFYPPLYLSHFFILLFLLFCLCALLLFSHLLIHTCLLIFLISVPLSLSTFPSLLAFILFFIPLIVFCIHIIICFPTDYLIWALFHEILFYSFSCL